MLYPLRWFTNKQYLKFLAWDIVIACITPLLALGLRLDDWTGSGYITLSFLMLVAIFVGIKLSMLHVLGLYRHYWRYASIDEMTELTIAGLTTLLLQSLVLYALYQLPQVGFEPIPRSLPLLDALLWFLLIAALRFSIRSLEQWRSQPSCPSQQRALIIGAGSAGIGLIRTLQHNTQLGLQPIGLIDDDPTKHNLTIHRLPVLGDRYAIPQLAQSLKVDSLIIAIPSASGDCIRDLLEICKSTGLPTKTLPSLNEFLNSRTAVSHLRDIQLEDLLRREPIQTDLQTVQQLAKGRRVLVTGAGGSIGSELCRQILRAQPQQLILLGKGENSLFTIQQELERTVQGMSQGMSAAPLPGFDRDAHQSDNQLIPKIHAFIADIRARDRLEQLFQTYRPEIIFHAAAHKHVPLMEMHPVEAITSNILGTQNLTQLAQAYNVRQFVMISTDKAVNPTSMMGASKRIAEMLVLQVAKKTGKPYMAVRFGNVLGSRGSVIPTFRQQIAAGGPVTITHPEVCRYFMTIPEAVQLVLQAAILGQGGEVFMFDMGQPVKIVDLAKDLIVLSGYRVGKDIDITFTGLRPGEKLYEELFIPGEEYEKTAHSKIIRVSNASRNLPENLTTLVNQLAKAAHHSQFELVRQLIEQVVVGYNPSPHNVHSPIKQARSPKDLAYKDLPFERPRGTILPPPLDAAS